MQPQQVYTMHQHQSPSTNGPQTKIVDLRPAPIPTVNTQFIILEKGDANKLGEGGPLVCSALVADESACVHMQLWGTECEFLQPGDIYSLTSGMFSFHNKSLTLRAGRKGKLEKIGEFTMVFTENPNMSRMQWVQDPNDSKKWMPAHAVGMPNFAPPIRPKT